MSDSTSVGQITLDLLVNQAEFNRQMSGIAGYATGMLSGAFMRLGGIIAAALAVKGLINFGKESIALASNLNEVQNVVNVTFGNMSNQINTFSQNAINQFGLTELQAKKFSATMGTMLKSSGQSGQQLVDMSEKLTGLTADMASFYNLSKEDMFAKLQSGLAGMPRPLREFGINMSATNLQVYALKEGIKQNYKSMDNATQTLLRYNYLINATKDAQGDFARTSGSWANQTRLLTGEWQRFQATMGQAFINVLTPVLQGLNALINKLQIAADYFHAFTVAMFGEQKVVSTTTDSAAASQDNLANKIGKTAKAAKNSLASFDQLNVLTKAVASSANTTPADTGVLDKTNKGPTVKPVVDPKMFDPLKKALNDIMAPLRDINFTPLITALRNLRLACEPLVQSLFDGLKWLYDNVMVPFAKWTIEKALPAFLNLLSSCLKVLSPLIDSFKPLVLWLFNSFLKPLASWTGGVIVSVLNDVASALTKIGNWMTENKPIVSGITKVVVDFFAAWKVIQLLSFIQTSGGIAGAFTKITTAIKACTIAKLADNLATVKTTLLNAKDLVVGLAKSTAAWVAQKWAMLANEAALEGMSTAQYALNLAMEANPIGLVVTALAALAVGIYEVVKHWKQVKSVMGEVWDSMKKTFAKVGDWFSANVAQPIANIFKGIINVVIDGVNLLIGLLNKVKIPSMNLPIVGKVGGWGGMDLKPLKHLANGGVVSAPTLAMVGDNRGASHDPEVVAPLSKLQSMLGKSGTSPEVIALLNKIIQLLQLLQQKDGPVLKIGEIEFGRMCCKAINTANRQAGVNLIKDWR